MVQTLVLGSPSPAGLLFQQPGKAIIGKGFLCPIGGFSIYQKLSYAQEALQETFSSTLPCVRSTEDIHVLQLV
ncbi:hypothetical protein DUI87_17150 [Hirundo rustica rustica]|uniref:Uncharacterized protein n=1 Tax=Hirundo rustica rustica TaxID=333673 RepID=A0A3M0K3B9_HIRRU|nr:hypothetical protein DUI87_17150 [Hirundo rustica rustica]